MQSSRSNKHPVSRTRSGKKVPSSRFSRLVSLGGLASRLAGNIAVEGSKKVAQGHRPRINELLLTPNNVKKVADKLATMRGAAMKVGQLISMDAGTMLPPELSAVFDRLRSDGEVMPATQLISVLEKNWGADWQSRFTQFSFKPIAAASIGQVHSAVCQDGRHIALKIQYPGVRESMDSDIANVVMLLRISGFIPKSLDIEPLITEAKEQLKAESDYWVEGEHLESVRHKLESYPRRDELITPLYYPDQSSRDILAMSFESGEPLEQSLTNAPQRHQIMELIFDLFFTELFDFGLVQTDPNLANYLYQSDTQKLVLLDFGAVRSYTPDFVRDYWSAIEAAVEEDEEQLAAALGKLGFFNTSAAVANKPIILAIFMLAVEPLRCEGMYSFGSSNIALRIHELGMSISKDPDAWHTPPPDVLFLHRKMAGLYLMAARLDTQVDVRSIFLKTQRQMNL
ncbi:AarF/ABC1/UbiB kinase family protein [Neptunomonas phycophila]|uniref:ABC1 kinase family protein n=1 Tax=Neptunomonas phycophila TaxID=1572645 RepID=UPI0026E1AEA6|nr:AarF/ABC1/UbiB kinase family protein [Neptunomonas phycophila]MDO6782943.1 AarF/ABC1/UbiB kinase family protein [Neptunomonas phycophila]